MTAIDQYSVSTVPIEMYFNDTFLSIATAFVWRVDGDYFLITNWHNVSGKNPFTGKHVSDTLAEPSKVRAWWNLQQLGNKEVHDHALRDDNGQPLWLVHPEHGRSIDVVALPVVPPAVANPHPICDMPQEDLMVQVGMEVFILGYPYGLGHGGLPIWKRGSLATEPEVVGQGGQQHMLLDTASRPGMSGSPIIMRTWGTALMANDSLKMITGSATKFVGVYSGRLAAKDPLDAQLGMAWPGSLVGEIVSGGCRDSSE